MAETTVFNNQTAAGQSATTVTLAGAASVVSSGLLAGEYIKVKVNDNDDGWVDMKYAGLPVTLSHQSPVANLYWHGVVAFNLEQASAGGVDLIVRDAS